MKKLLLLCLMLFFVAAEVNGTITKTVEPMPVENTNISVCTTEWMPVCGEDGTTYGNKCQAKNANVEVNYGGECTEEIETAVIPLNQPLTENTCRERFGKPTEELQEEVSAKKRVRVGWEKDHVEALGLAAGMEVIISKAEELGLDTTQLRVHRDAYEAIRGTLETKVENPGDYKKAANEMKTQANLFRDTARNMTELKAVENEIKEEVKAKREEVREQNQAKLQEHKQKMEELALKEFDLHVCLAEEKINRMTNLGFDMTKAQEALQKFEGYRTNYSNALENNVTQARNMRQKAMRYWNDARAVYNKKVRVRVVKKKEEVLDDLNRRLLGMDNETEATQLMQKVQEMKEKFTELETRIAAGENITEQLRNVNTVRNQVQNKVKSKPVKFSAEEVRKKARVLEAKARVMAVQRINTDNPSDADVKAIKALNRIKDTVEDLKPTERELVAKLTRENIQTKKQLVQNTQQVRSILGGVRK